MSKLVKADTEHCSQCKYGTRFYGCAMTNRKTYCCDYMLIKAQRGQKQGNSRIFVNGKLSHDPSLCDKFEKGARRKKQTWEETNTMIYKNKED